MKKDHKRIVIALGGNVIKLPRQRGTYEEQLASIRTASHHILEFIRQGFNVVITHGNGPQVGNLLVQQEAGGSQVPAQHPTQALVDLYCIEKLKGGIDGVSIAFVGDLLNSRTIRSLTYFLAKYSGIKIYFVSPRVLKMKDDMKDYLREHQVPCSETLDSAVDWGEIASKADILYITQIPREQFGDQVDDYERSKEIFRVNPDILKALRKDTYIMHPFPRDHELPMEIDQDPRAVYFDLIKYGQFLRMGLLCHVLRVPVG
jgi:aspartate carbamoyltransferase catalytic subunit